MDFTHETLDGLGSRAQALIEKGDKYSDKSVEMYTSAGLHLQEARERIKKRKDVNWGDWLKQHGISVGRDFKCRQIAGALTELDDAKAAAEKHEKFKEKQREADHKRGRTPNKEPESSWSMKNQPEKPNEINEPSDEVLQRRHAARLISMIPTSKLDEVIAYLERMTK